MIISIIHRCDHPGCRKHLHETYVGSVEKSGWAFINDGDRIACTVHRRLTRDVIQAARGQADLQDDNQTRRSHDTRPTTTVVHAGAEHVGVAPPGSMPEDPGHTGRDRRLVHPLVVPILRRRQ